MLIRPKLLILFIKSIKEFYITSQLFLLSFECNKISRLHFISDLSFFFFNSKVRMRFLTQRFNNLVRIRIIEVFIICYCNFLSIIGLLNTISHGWVQEQKKRQNQ